MSDFKWRGDKEYTGSALSPSTNGPSTPCPVAAHGSKDNKNAGHQGTTTSNVSWAPARKNLWPASKHSSEASDTGSSPDQTPPAPTFTRTRRISKAHGSNTVRDLISAIQRQTGTLFGKQRSKMILEQSPLLCELFITAPSEQSARTIFNQLQWYGPQLCITGGLVLASQEEPGMKLGWTVTLKTQEPSFGTVTEVRRTLSSMSFEVTTVTNSRSN